MTGIPANEKQLKVVLDASPIGVSISNYDDGKIIYANAALGKLYGGSKEELLGSDSIKHYRDQDDIRWVINQLQQNLPVANHEMEIYRNDGSILWCQVDMVATQVDNERVILTWFSDISERKQAAEALKKSEAEFRELAQMANSIILKFDQKFNFTFINQYALDFFGYSEIELIGKNLMGTIVPEIESTGRNLQEMLDYMLQQPQKFIDNENENVCKNGERVWVAWRNKGIYDVKGELQGIQCMGYDITERKSAEEALKNSEQHLNQIISFLPDPTFVIDKQGEIIAWNRSLEELTGFKTEDMLGKGNYEHAIPFYGKRRPTMIDLVISDDPSLDHLYAYVRRKSERFESESYIPDLKSGGAYLYNTARALYDIEGQLIGAIESVRDITEFKLAQKSLEDSQHQLAEIIDFLPDSTLVIDANGTIQFWNKSMENLTKIKSENMVGKGNYEYALPFYGERRPLLVDMSLNWERSFEEKYISVKKLQEGVLISESYHPKMAGGIFLSGTARVLYDAENNKIGAIETLRDISEVKKAEEALQTARKVAEEANVAKSEFLANMSHEIRTPMNAIIGLAYLTLNTDLTAKQRNFLQKMMSSAQNLLQVINDILDYSKIEAGKLQMEQIDFRLDDVLDAISNLIAVKAEEKDLEVVFSTTPDVPQNLIGDPFRLGQVVTNLAMTAHAMVGDRQKSLEAGMNDHLTKPINPDELYSALLRWIKPTLRPQNQLKMDPPPGTGSCL
ncbi:MAG: PAS domain S-box protein [SAR324 cluster bacterium]|nr:PAS domain S-box protein [SAR324 cluster bacterium]